MINDAACDCKKLPPNRGYVARGRFMVHAICGKPARAFLENIVTEHGTTDGTRLNLFYWGAHHNEVWTNDQLLYKCPELESATWITDYRWTWKTVTGSKSGKVARVWVLRTASEEELAKLGVHPDGTLVTSS